MPDHRTEARRLARNVGKALAGLGLPKRGEYAIEEGPSFELFDELKQQIELAAEIWYLSLSAEVQVSSANRVGKLHEWLLARKKTLEVALRSKLALHFDVLVLGIVSRSGYLCVTLS